MTNEDKLNEIEKELKEAIEKLDKVNDSQGHYSMHRSLGAIVDFIDDDVPEAKGILERILNTLDSIELEDEE